MQPIYLFKLYKHALQNPLCAAVDRLLGTKEGADLPLRRFRHELVRAVRQAHTSFMLVLTVLRGGWGRSDDR